MKKKEEAVEEDLEWYWQISIVTTIALAFIGLWNIVPPAYEWLTDQWVTKAEMNEAIEARVAKAECLQKGGEWHLRGEDASKYFGDRWQYGNDQCLYPLKK